MSYQERRAIVSLVSTMLITVLYAAYMVQRYPDAGPYSKEVLHYWGAFFLILIPVSIVAKIVITIVFSILNTIATQEAEPSITDERDRMVELKAAQKSLYVFAVGVMLAMGALVLELPPATMFIVLICAGVVSEMVSELLQVFYYRRGF